MNASRNLLVITLAIGLVAAATPSLASKPKPATKPAPAPASAAASAASMAARRALQAAVTRGSMPDIVAARAQFAVLAAESPTSAWSHYWLAVADWRAAPRFGDTGKAMAEKTCMEGIAEIDQAIKLAPTEGEFQALRANLMGLSLQFHPGDMMSIGPEIEASMQRALTQSPSNPRVQLLAGINTLNKPAFVGGGADRSLPLFRKSQQLFAAAPADSTLPDWGHDDAWLWCGRAEMKLGDPAAAKQCYAKALEISPGHAWVTYQLMPEAEKALAVAGASGK